LGGQDKEYTIANTTNKKKEWIKNTLKNENKIMKCGEKKQERHQGSKLA